MVKQMAFAIEKSEETKEKGRKLCICACGVECGRYDVAKERERLAEASAMHIVSVCGERCSDRTKEQWL